MEDILFLIENSSLKTDKLGLRYIYIYIYIHLYYGKMSGRPIITT